jgi:DNA-binding response OmpR family regulator
MSRRITVVDDSPEFLTLMQDVLEMLGHQMTGLAAVEVSFEEVVATRPDLLVIDLNLANPPQQISGWELVVLARAHEELQGIPLILCTADVFELRKREHELQRFADVHVLAKPFELGEMCALIRGLLERQAGDGTASALASQP